MKKTRILALMLALCLVCMAFVACKKQPSYKEGNFTYQDSFTTAPSTWNQHNYHTTDDAYILDFTMLGLYQFNFNETYDGYVVVPEMAASEPVDVTSQFAGNAKYNVPADATKGYAYTIDLNKKACWSTGEKITADDYVESMKLLLDPTLLNYRASGYYEGKFELANASKYVFNGTTVQIANSADGEKMTYQFADLVKGADGYYTTPEGKPAYFGLETEYAWLGPDTLTNCKSYFPEAIWTKLSGMADEDGYIKINDEAIETLYEFTGSSTWGNETREQLGYYVSYDKTYDVFDWDNVGIFKSGEYQITIILDKALSGFYLLYNLTDNWVVKTDLYKAGITESNGLKSTNYNTSVDTSASCGPYVLTSFQDSKEIVLERNNNWWGYTDGKHEGMWQTSKIVATLVEEASTRLEMFLKGELETYGLQADDYATYRSSDYYYYSPGTTVFFFIFCGDFTSLESRQKLQTNVNKTIFSIKEFRQAIAVSFDKDAFAATISPARKGAFSVIGDQDVYNVETGASYRSTEQGMKILCDFYGVDTTKFESLELAAESITGYDPELAKSLYLKAYEDALAKGWIDADDIIEIEYDVSSASAFQTKIADYVNEQLNTILKGTVLENRIKMVVTAYGGDWSTTIREGRSDMAFAGWNGGMLDPYNTMCYYALESYQPYCDLWFDTNSEKFSLTLPGYNDGKPIEMSITDWTNALNGTETNGYNFAFDLASYDTRLEILAGLEKALLNSYCYIPMLQDASGFLLSMKVNYITEDYDAVMGRGGIRYMTYNFTDEEWTAYVAEQGGTLKYN